MVYRKKPEGLETLPASGGAAERSSGAFKTKDAAGSAKRAGAGSGILKGIGAILKGAGKPAFVAALGLLVVWCLGRVMEAVHGNAIFDTTLTYWLGMVIFILLALWVIGSGTSSLVDIGEARDKKRAVLCWLFFAVMVFIVMYTLKGYRISSEGLFAAAAGSAENSRQTNFLLFKFHSFNPMLALNLAASKLMGTGWDMESLTPYILSWNVLFAFFIWSLAYGIVILMQRSKRGAKSVHLFLAAFGLLILIVLKSVLNPTVEQLMLIQAAATILLVFQVLLAYASLRAVAGGPKEEAPEPDAFRVYSPEDNPSPQKRYIGLPPSAFKIALLLFLVVPVFMDLHNQFVLSHSTNKIVRQISALQGGGAPKLVAVTAVSIRSGPAAGDDVLGILPKGSSVEVVDKKNDWVNIGENRWVPEKFMRPEEGK